MTLLMKMSTLPLAAAVLLLAVAGCDSGTGPVAPSPRPSPPSTPPTPRTSPSPPPANQPPRLELRVTPTPIAGRAPLAVSVSLCRSEDPEGDPLAYVYEYQGEGKRFASHCSERHVYAAPLRAQAVFCVSDGMPRHLICRPFQVAVE